MVCQFVRQKCSFYPRVRECNMKTSPSTCTTCTPTFPGKEVNYLEVACQPKSPTARSLKTEESTWCQFWRHCRHRRFSTTTCGVVSDGKVGIMTTLGFQRRYLKHSISYYALSTVTFNISHRIYTLFVICFVVLISSTPGRFMWFMRFIYTLIYIHCNMLCSMYCSIFRLCIRMTRMYFILYSDSPTCSFVCYIIPISKRTAQKK